MSNNTSNIQIVDVEDALLEVKDYNDIDFSNDIYRITVLWVVDSEDNVLVTKRDLPMLDENDIWAPSVVGVVVDRETYRTNPLNEAANQLGLDDVELRAGPKQLFEGSKKYFCRWYMVELEDEQMAAMLINDEEISDSKWVNVDELAKDVAENSDEYVSTMQQSIETLQEMMAP
jgi:isopentenyldiphosphate isomerase